VSINNSEGWRASTSGGGQQRVGTCMFRLGACPFDFCVSTSMKDEAMTVQELHDAFVRDNYHIIPKAAARIATADSASVRTHGSPEPLFSADDAIRLPTSRPTRDEILTSINSGKTIGLGTVWDGTGVNSKLDAATAVVRDIVNGLASGRVLHAEDPGVVISLGRTYEALAKDESMRKALGTALDTAEELWKQDKRSTDEAHDLPPNNGTTDSSRVRRNYLPGSAKGISTTDYAAGLKKGREAQAVTAPAKVRAASASADYAAILAAGRAKTRT
jgi:hypothetical protein